MEGEKRAVDLFGQPVLERHEGRGRPEHVRSVENSNRVLLMFAMGHSKKEAALAIGVSVPTLRKHYFSEVAQYDAARLKFEALQLERLNDEAADGNVGAVKELFKRFDRAQLVSLSDRVTKRQEAKPAPVGKKQAAKEAATRVAGVFAPPDAPQLLN